MLKVKNSSYFFTPYFITLIFVLTMKTAVRNNRHWGGFFLFFLFFSLVIGGSIYVAGSGSDLRREKMALNKDSLSLQEKFESDKEKDGSPDPAPISLPSAGTFVQLFVNFFRTFRPVAILDQTLSFKSIVFKEITSTVIVV